MKTFLRAFERLFPTSPPVSLRLWLQSSTVLAVLAGYTLLVVLNVSLARLDRRRAHQELTDLLMTELVRRVRSPAQLNSFLDGLVVPGLEVQLAAPAPARPPRLVRQGERMLIESSSPLMLADGRPQSLRLRQDVTASIAHQNLSLQLLSAAAGGAALFTALLLRPVLTRGLVRPLEGLGRQLTSYRLPPAPPMPLDVEAQPEELRPIAASFNTMQERLAASWERQRSFVDGVAHELRTPITLISGHAQSLQRSSAAAALGPSLALISAEARRMGGMVSDMLDLARQDAGRLQLRLQPIDLEDILLEAYERLVAGTAGRLRLEPPSRDGAPPLAAGDPARLEQCLATLVDNAVRYAPQGPISLAVEVREPELLLHVRDQGPGVPASEREAIFERFVRGTASVDVRGSGIGLSVAQSLMQAMGGRITVAEGPGGGADFQLHLPRWSEPRAAVSAADLP